MSAAVATIDSGTNPVSNPRNPTKDQRLDDPAEKIFRLFDGSTTLWRTGTNLDVLIIHHQELDCLETVIYEPAANLEAPRIYCRASAVCSCLDNVESERKINERKELSLRQRKDFNENEAILEIRNDFMVNYITTRIALDLKAKERFKFRIYLQSKFGDTTFNWPMEQEQLLDGASPDGAYIDTVIERPDKLIPIYTEHFAKLAGG